MDISGKFEPTVVAYVLLFDYTVFPRGHFDVVWASPHALSTAVQRQLAFATLLALTELLRGRWKS